MKTVREWMQDKRVAAALAAVALLFVVYRFYPKGTGKAPAVPAPVEGTKPQTQDMPADAFATPSPVATGGKPATPAATARPVAWSWDRNPFVHTWKERGPAGGYGGQAAVGNADDGDRRGAGQEPPSGLRGTVVTGSSGIAIFGNRLVPVGGRIGDWTVERVDPYSVVLRNAKEVRVVELYKPAPTGVRSRGGDR